MQGDILPFGLRRNPVWRDSSNVKRERAVRDVLQAHRLGLLKFVEVLHKC